MERNSAALPWAKDMRQLEASPLYFLSHFLKMMKYPIMYMEMNHSVHIGRIHISITTIKGGEVLKIL